MMKRWWVQVKNLASTMGEVVHELLNGPTPSTSFDDVLRALFPSTADLDRFKAGALMMAQVGLTAEQIESLAIASARGGVSIYGEPLTQSYALHQQPSCCSTPPDSEMPAKARSAHEAAAQAGFKAVWDSGFLTDSAYANARIWKAVEVAVAAAIEAVPTVPEAVNLKMGMVIVRRDEDGQISVAGRVNSKTASADEVEGDTSALLMDGLGHMLDRFGRDE